MEVPRTDLCGIIIKKQPCIMSTEWNNPQENTTRGTHPTTANHGGEKDQDRRPTEPGKVGSPSDATRTNPGQDRSGQPDGKKDDRQPAHPKPDHETEREEGNDASRTRAEEKGRDEHRGNKMPDGQKTQVEGRTK